MRDGALYAQAEATKSMTTVQMKKIVLIEDQNMLLLMTMPIEESAGEDAREYLRLRRGEEHDPPHAAALLDGDGAGPPSWCCLFPNNYFPFMFLLCPNFLILFMLSIVSS
jgi:hypothetical protein